MLNDCGLGHQEWLGDAIDILLLLSFWACPVWKRGWSAVVVVMDQEMYERQRLFCDIFYWTVPSNMGEILHKLLGVKQEGYFMLKASPIKDITVITLASNIVWKRYFQHSIVLNSHAVNSIKCGPFTQLYQESSGVSDNSWTHETRRESCLKRHKNEFCKDHFSAYMPLWGT